MKSFVVVIEKAEHNYSAYLPDVPGCVSTGDSIEETLQNIKDALEFHLESMIEEKLPMPQLQPLEKHLKDGNIFFDDDIIIANIHAEISKEFA